MVLHSSQSSSIAFLDSEVFVANANAQSPGILVPYGKRGILPSPTGLCVVRNQLLVYWVISLLPGYRRS